MGALKVFLRLMVVCEKLTFKSNFALFFHFGCNFNGS